MRKIALALLLSTAACGQSLGSLYCHPVGTLTSCTLRIAIDYTYEVSCLYDADAVVVSCASSP